MSVDDRLFFRLFAIFDDPAKAVSNIFGHWHKTISAFGLRSFYDVFHISILRLELPFSQRVDNARRKRQRESLPPLLGLIPAELNGLIKATPRNPRLTPLHVICLHFFRHSTQILLAVA